jgi:hypothetical protein
MHQLMMTQSLMMKTAKEDEGHREAPEEDAYHPDTMTPYVQRPYGLWRRKPRDFSDRHTYIYMGHIIQATGCQRTKCNTEERRTRSPDISKGEKGWITEGAGLHQRPESARSSKGRIHNLADRLY